MHILGAVESAACPLVEWQPLTLCERADLHFMSRTVSLKYLLGKPTDVLDFFDITSVKFILVLFGVNRICNITTP